MIDLYYWQHSDRRLAASKEEICLAWDPPDEARSVVGTGRVVWFFAGLRRAKAAGM